MEINLIRQPLYVPLLMMSLAACHTHRNLIPSRNDVKPDVVMSGKLQTTTIEDSVPHSLPVILAILPFRNNTGFRELDSIGLLLNDGLPAHIGSAPLKLVERERLEEVINELHISDIYADPATAVRIGRLLGANMLALGAYTKNNRDTLVTIRMVKVETGEIVGGFSEAGTDVPLLAAQSAERLVRALAGPGKQ